MKKLFKILGLIILLLLAFVLVTGIFVEKKVHLERSVVINAPKEKVWSHVNTLHGMHDWNPWRELDPNMQISYKGNQDGTPGAVYEWKGNSEVGSGTQTIASVTAPDNIKTDMHFTEPFDALAEAFINVADGGDATKVTWGFDTEYKYPMNTMLLFVNMDKSLGSDFSRGLEKLKVLCEK